ncbi:cytochrome C [Thalassospira profundimaris]|uniref:Cytochrome C n=1 Tax=Thalassospira profundimaris TaxID=502049 RepID=A0A367WSQ3_9PROT|nr:cytochrome c [Thalassospira profundimaris]RCK44473.1 cytochrome C [Thalassospira profundimaris]
MKRFVKIALLTATLGVSAAAVPAQADEAGDNAAVQSRQHMMAGLGGAMGTLGCYMKGECNLPKGVVHLLAEGIAYSASTGHDVFKPETPAATEKTEAKADIWANWDDFAGHFPKLEENALKLADVAGDKAAMGPIMAEMGKSCKGCHDDYRSK